MLKRDWCPRVNPPLGISGSGCRSPGTTSAACRVHLGACRCTLVGLRLPPGPNFQALLPVKLLSISTPLHLSQSLHPNITCRPGAADSMHPGLITPGGGCLRGPTWESRKDRTMPSLNRTPCFKSHAPSPKSFAALLTQQPPGLLSPSLTPAPCPCCFPA